jgi:hypothetical protein
MDLFNQLENIKSLEVVYGPPMPRLFDGFGRHDNVYNLGQYVPDVVCPGFGDETKTTYEIENPIISEAFIRYEKSSDRLNIEVNYDCNNKLVNEIHGEINTGHLRIVCDIESAEIKTQFLNGIENKFNLDELDYGIEYGVEHEELDFNSIHCISVMEIHGERKIYIKTRNNSGVYRIID